MVRCLRGGGLGRWLVPGVMTFFLMVGAVFAKAAELERLVEELKGSKESASGVGGRDQEIAKRLQEIGPEAVPLLLPLLDSPSESVRNAAAYTIRDMPGLTEKELPALMVSQRRESGWLPVGIARIGTPEAVDYLVGELVRTRETDGQISFAVAKLGLKAIPGLLALYRQEGEMDEELERALSTVFGWMKGKGSGAVSPLLEVAADTGIAPTRRAAAINALGAIGDAARSAVPELLRLRSDESDAVRNASSSAIMSIGTAEAVPLYVEMLETSSSDLDRQNTLWRMGQLEEDGRSVGPVVMRYLGHANWDVRLAAVEALGKTHYREATGALIEALGDERDWRVVFAAASSLGLLRAEEALPALQVVAGTHWYPPVRDAAERAERFVRGEREIVEGDDGQGGAVLFSLYDYTAAGLELPLSYESVDQVFGVLNRQAGSEREKVLTRDKKGELVYEEVNGTRVQSGFLAGTDHGEWGGEITFIDPLGFSTKVCSENVAAIFAHRDGAVAVTGLAHLGMNEGMLYKVVHEGGKWTATPWRKLPGAPLASWLLKNGDILTVCIGGGVLVSPDGRMKGMTGKEALELTEGVRGGSHSQGKRVFFGP